MSKIIKAQESQVESFQFRPLPAQGGSVSSSFPVAVSGELPDGVPEELPPEVAPLEELEATIQSRLLEVERRAMELEKEAYEKGYAQGEKDGLEYGKRSILIVKEHLEGALHGLQELPRKVLDDYRDWLVTASLAIARKIVRRELELQPDILLHIARNLCEEAVGDHRITVHLNPKDFDLLSRTEELKHWVRESERPLLLKPDPELKRGDCRVETDIQLLDAGLETQFALIESALHAQIAPADPVEASESQ